ncbi:DNA-binding protein [Staphylococcus gallinarum]|uniref:DNA-binding protein n=1 Tax=Staphylococcus gallinarum TaxID=1293 RepID=A0A3A0VPC1_STAGA|nr:thermonuclease family protein [Staphylococcus gallinarum]RIP33996.1 DNA-binding protein [Staphylococcus gallinarum]
MKKVLFLILASFLVLAACGSKEDSKSEDKKETKTSSKDDTSKTEDKKSEHKAEKKEESKSKHAEQEKEKKEETDKPKPGTTDKIPVKLSSTVDGDTAKFVYNGNTESFRFLLIDTPETKHPRVGKQPFGQEASDRTSELLNNSQNIEVEFDVGQKEDKYNRKLAYIYVDGEMLNNILVREGLAKISYVYPPNTRYLNTLEASQEQAKSEKIGIWSIDSAFKEGNKTEHESDDNNGTNVSETNVDNSSSDNNQSTETVESSNNKIESYPNCTALREVHPNGVPSSHPAYAPKHDRDNDDYACEVN